MNFSFPPCGNSIEVRLLFRFVFPHDRAFERVRFEFTFRVTRRLAHFRPRMTAGERHEDVLHFFSADVFAVAFLGCSQPTPRVFDRGFECRSRPPTDVCLFFTAPGNHSYLPFFARSDTGTSVFKLRFRKLTLISSSDLAAFKHRPNSGAAANALAANAAQHAIPQA